MLRDIAIPTFGCKSHLSIDVRHGFIQRQMVTDAAAYNGARLREGLIDRTNTASSVWEDTAYRSATNEAFLASIGKTSQTHRKKPKDRPMPISLTNIWRTDSAAIFPCLNSLLRQGANSVAGHT